jgi:SAM-dependent methyltransferase
LDTWCKDFFDTASNWWPRPVTGATDQDRLTLLRHFAGPPPKKVLELGSGSGTTAAATAAAGYLVLGVEISETRVKQARDLALATVNAHSGVCAPSFIEADFYTVNLTPDFDVVTYWNGFGVGSDQDQRLLLTRISREWMTPGGCLIMDIYAPWRWARIAGNRYEVGDLVCENSFDPTHSRFVERWYRKQEPDRPVTQYGRCYSPADFLLLITDLDLSVTEFWLDNKIINVDDETDYLLRLLDAWQYTAILRRRTPSSGDGPARLAVTDLAPHGNSITTPSAT